MSVNKANGVVSLDFEALVLGGRHSGTPRDRCRLGQRDFRGRRRLFRVPFEKIREPVGLGVPLDSVNDRSIRPQEECRGKTIQAVRGGERLIRLRLEFHGKVASVGDRLDPVVRERVPLHQPASPAPRGGELNPDELSSRPRFPLGGGEIGVPGDFASAERGRRTNRGDNQDQWTKDAC